MPLTLITGRANAGKTGRAYEMLKQALVAGESAVLIVPNHADEGRARRELGSQFPIGLRVATFDNHISALWDSLGDGRRIITPAQRSLLASVAARSVADAPPGLSGLLEDVIRRLADSAGVLWRGASSSGVLGCAVSEYARLTQAHGLIEPGESFEILSEQGVLPATQLVFNRFSDMTPSQMRFVQLVCDTGARVVVSLTWEAGFPATEVLDSVIEHLSSLGEHVHLSTDEESQGELMAIERGLFQGQMGVSLSGSVGILESEGPEAEAEQIAILCRLAVNSGTSPDRIAVTRRSLGGFATYIEAALGEVGLSVNIDRSAKPAEAPIGAALQSLLAFVTTGRREDLCAFLRGPYSGMSPATTAQLEHGWRYRVVRDRQTLVRDLGRTNGPAVESLREARAADAQGSPEAWERVMRRLFRLAWGSPGEPIAQAGQDAATLATLVRFLDDVRRLEGISVKAQDLSSALVTLGVTPHVIEQSGAVQVMDMERLQGRRFDIVVLAGLSVGVFPRHGEDALSAPVIGRLFTSVGAEPPMRGGLARERMLFYEVVTRPREKLILARSNTSISGETQPSSFWHEFLDLYREKDEPVVDASVPEGLRIATATCPPRQELRRLLAVCPGDDRAALFSDAPALMRRAAPGVPVVLSHEARDALRSIETFSPSSLEAYVQCPYKWFLERYLRSKDVDREFDARVRGSAAHAALRCLYENLETETGLSRFQDDDKEIACEQAAAAVDEALSNAVSSGDIPDAWANRLRTSTRVRVTRRAIADGCALEGFRPTHFEWDYSKDGPVDVGGLLLKGRIDRIDCDEQGRAVVLDYKLTGGVGAEFWEREGVLQMPLYMAVVRAKLGLEPVAGLYATLAPTGAVSLRGVYVEGVVSGGVSTSGRAKDAMELDDLRNLIEVGVERARCAVKDIHAGEIAPRPGKACEYCAFTGLCQEARS